MVKERNCVIWIQKNKCFIVYIKTHVIYKDIADDFEIRFDTSVYEIDEPLPKGKNRKIIGLMED